jgi:ribose transport system substrate-binding protein
VKKKLSIVAGSVLVSAALVLTGCTTGTDTPSGSTDSEISPEAQAALDTAFAGIGGDLVLEPAAAPEGINLYVVSCGEQVPGCSIPAAAVADAGEAAGWTSTIADGKLNPDGFAAAIRQGIAGGADVIVPIGIGCGVAAAAFQEAVDAGITVIGGGGVDDCEPKLWASERLWLEDYTPVQQWNAYGKLQADYAFGTHDGDVKAVIINFTGQVWGQWVTDGFAAELDALGAGEILETIDVSDQEVGDGSFVQKVTTALLNHPDANTLVVPIDGMLSNGLAQAVLQTGLDLLVIGRGGDAPVIDMIRQGGSGVGADIGYASEWGAWGSIDTAIRILNGQDPVYIGEPIQAVDADNNLPESGGYAGGADFKSIFLEAWGK